MIQLQNIYRKRDEVLKRIRTLFNTLLILDPFVLFLIFGGSKSINPVMLFSSTSIFGSIYVERMTEARFFESTVVLVSIVVLLKTLYAIAVEMIFFDKK